MWNKPGPSRDELFDDVHDLILLYVCLCVGTALLTLFNSLLHYTADIVLPFCFSKIWRPDVNGGQ